MTYRAAVLVLALSASACRPEGPTIVSFTAQPTEIAAGGKTTLSWVVPDATLVTIREGAQTISDKLPESGSHEVAPVETTTYKLTAYKGNAQSTASVTVRVVDGAIIENFVATPASIPV